MVEFHCGYEARGGGLGRQVAQLDGDSLEKKQEQGTNQALLNSFLYLLNLDLTEALDLQESSASSSMNGLSRVMSALMSIAPFQWPGVSYCHSVEAIGFQFSDISCTDAVGLDTVDVDDEVLPI